nr:MAG TPA: hypothetical protein [Caudoviricetes sp.]
MCVLPSFSFPYNCKRKQAARTQAAKQAPAQHGRKAKASACNVTRGTQSRAAKR